MTPVRKCYGKDDVGGKARRRWLGARWVTQGGGKAEVGSHRRRSGTLGSWLPHVVLSGVLDVTALVVEVELLS